MTTAPPAQRRIAAIILNYRTPQLVADCLPTVASELDPERDEIIVVDNASGDSSAQEIRDFISRRGFPHARLVEAPHNGGFSAGNNLGVSSTPAEAYLLLNSDTLVRPGAPERLWQTLCSSPDIGLVSPRLEWPDGTPQISCFRLHSPWSEIIQGSQTAPIRRLLSSWDVPIPVADYLTEPAWTSFAAVLIRREVFDSVGPLDEGYFMYYEDVDYCRRARNLGWRIVNEPAARIVHLRGGTSPVKALQRERKRRPRYYYRSRARYFRKAYNPLGLVLANGCWTLGRAIAGARELVGSKRPHAVDFELLDTWRG